MRSLNKTLVALALMGAFASAHASFFGLGSDVVELDPLPGIKVFSTPTNWYPPPWGVLHAFSLDDEMKGAFTRSLARNGREVKDEGNSYLEVAKDDFGPVSKFRSKKKTGNGFSDLIKNPHAITEAVITAAVKMAAGLNPAIAIASGSSSVPRAGQTTDAAINDYAAAHPEDPARMVRGQVCMLQSRDGKVKVGEQPKYSCGEFAAVTALPEDQVSYEQLWDAGVTYGAIESLKMTKNPEKKK